MAVVGFAAYTMDVKRKEQFIGAMAGMIGLTIMTAFIWRSAIGSLIGFLVGYGLVYLHYKLDAPWD